MYFNPKDSIEEELYSALGANEAIPGEYLEHQKKLKTGSVYNYDKHEYEKDEDGKILYRVNMPEVKLALKRWARRWADHGIAIDEIDFDQYKLDRGLSLDKVPNKTVALVQINSGDFIVIDKRVNRPVDEKYWGADDAYMTRYRDGRRVPLRKIPESQIMSGTKNIWIIPEEELKSDTIAKRKERVNSKANLAKRYKSLDEVSIWNTSGLELDKSGYLIDRREIKRKLDDYKLKKQLNEFEGDYLELGEKYLLEITDKFNLIVDKILSEIGKSIKEGKGGDTSILGLLSSAKTSLKSTSSRLRDYIGRLSSDEKEGLSESYIEKVIKELLNSLKHYWEKDYYGKRIQEYYYRIIGESEANESIFIPKHLSKALEEEV